MSEYPKSMYAKDGSFITVMNQSDDDEYRARGWMDRAPIIPAPVSDETKKGTKKA